MLFCTWREVSDLQVNTNNFNTYPNNVHEVQLPPNLFNTHRDPIRVDHHGDVEEKEIQPGPLSARAVFQTFNRIQSLQRRPAPSEADAKEVNRYDCSVRKVVGWLRGGCECGEQNVGEEAAEETAEQHLSPPQFVEERSAVYRAKHAKYGVDGVDEQLLVGICYAGVFDHRRHKVRDDVVAAPLSEECHSNDHSKSIARRPSIDQLAHLPPWVRITGSGEVIANFLELELDNGRVGISVSMVLRHYGYGFFAAVLGDEPPVTRVRSCLIRDGIR